MAVTTSMFIFEVVVSNVKSMVESRNLIIRSDFADIFSLELKDPKHMFIPMPEPLPLPPEPPGKKKGKKKPKPKKGKKGKKGAVEAPPPEPNIQSGQSVLFTSSAEVLIQNMKKFPMELSLWSKEEYLVYIGGNKIPWDPKFLVFLQEICNCKEPGPVIIDDEYNIFEENTAKIMVKLGLQVKLTNLTDKVTTSFRSLSEDPNGKKYLYTGMNSKTTSYICTLKTTDDEYEQNLNKIPATYVKDNKKIKPIAYADFRNAPGANLSSLSDTEYCCKGNADKPPDNVYKSPETCPDIDFIIDYVRRVIISCNDNMRMLTPRPTIRPRIKATDIDKLCYCKETSWPKGELAERFRDHVQGGPCPNCIDTKEKQPGHIKTTFDIANLRGPCGRPDCRVARRLREYIERLVNEDSHEIDLSSIIGPCGSKNCTLAEKILEFIKHEGVFSHTPQPLEGLTTRCVCLNTMQKALTETKVVCDEECEKGCVDVNGVSICPYDQETSDEAKEIPEYKVYYCMVKYNFEKDSVSSTSSQKTTNTSPKCASTLSSEKALCSKSTCSSFSKQHRQPLHKKKVEYWDMSCPPKNETFPPSPADSDIVVRMEQIINPCCVKSCDVAERVKAFIEDSIRVKAGKSCDDPCYCDCDCTWKNTRRTTYCAVCGGYEILGDDMRDQPVHIKPHPCPVYHRLYDKKLIKTPNIWPEEERAAKQQTSKSKQNDPNQGKGSKSKVPLGSTTSKPQAAPEKKSDRRMSNPDEKNVMPKKDKKKSGKTASGVTKTTHTLDTYLENVMPKKDKKKSGKTASGVTKTTPVKKAEKSKYIYPAVPKTMGWNWKAEDVPGMKPRPKWRPGGCNKLLVRRYRALREGVDVIAKKKRAMMQKKKKTEMRPTLVIKKEKGEYTVQMEVFKKYSKERMLHQFPYEEKPPVIYTIGKTEEEKRKIQHARERKERRETRRKSKLLQSTFRDRCQEICLKAYNQAIGLLPLPNPNDPNCPCYTEPDPNFVSPPILSCSCSEEDIVSSSDTDEDDWIIEFTPPAARWDPKAKHVAHMSDNETQYNYLDYKVKLHDKQGNPVPRYFKGPDGSQQCSDLGGFWGPKHVWLEINKDGYIGPDNRWVPSNFTGPDGMYYSSEEGQFIDAKGQVVKIGIDGYIDQESKWVWYPKRRLSSANISMADTKTINKFKNSVKGKGDEKCETPPANAKLGRKGITKVTSANETKQEFAPTKDKVKLNVPTVGRGGRNHLVMNISVNQDKTKLLPNTSYAPPKLSYYAESNRLNKYKEIMKDLQIFDDLQELKPLTKTNRASNTTKKMIMPFTSNLKKQGNPFSTSIRSFYKRSDLLSSSSHA